MGPSERATRGCLARIEKLNPTLNAYVTVMAESALADARRADAAAAKGDSLGLLHGLPLSVKDCLDVAGVRCTNGSPLFADYVPNADAEAVARCRREGAVIVGKTNLHELCFGSTSQNQWTGRVKNPWALDRIPSGSSGGAGAALAADLCVAALGSDTGGSVRTPAAVNGVSGLRPTQGAISMRGSKVGLSAQFDTVGPMARRADDVARLFAVMAAYDPADPASVPHVWPNFLPSLGEGVAGLRIGVARNLFYADVEPAVEASVRAAAEVFRRLGARVEDVVVPGAEDAVTRGMPVVLADVAEFWRDEMAQAPQMFSAPVRARIELGFKVSGLDYAEAMRWGEGWRRAVDGVFQAYDLVLCPTTVPAPTVAEAEQMLATTIRLNRITFAWTFARTPGLSVPCGLSADGLPLGLLINGPAWSEPLLFRAGSAFQAATDWHEKRPPLAA